MAKFEDFKGAPGNLFLAKPKKMKVWKDRNPDAIPSWRIDCPNCSSIPELGINWGFGWDDWATAQRVAMAHVQQHREQLADMLAPTGLEAHEEEWDDDESFWEWFGRVIGELAKLGSQKKRDDYTEVGE